METIKFLLFAASPRGAAPLDLPREFREIDQEVRMSRHRDAVELILVPGARPVDLLRELNEKRPQVVHLSGHGEPDEFILESGDEEADEAGLSGAPLRSPVERDLKRFRPEATRSEATGPGQPHRVGKSALVDVLRSCDEGNLRLVVLNACHTTSQAEALTAVVDCVVSMNRAISDRAAIKFAASFYGALAFGRSVRTAFEQGLARLSAEGIGETDTPELLVRAGVDASRVVLVGPAPAPTPVPGAPPAAEIPFIVPFPRNADFVGRDGDLARLHASLTGSDAGPVGIRPAGLTGMGGIGKTQLAVEYVHRQREDYPHGIFWLDAAGPLVEGFARLATDPRLRWADADRPRDEQIRAAFAALNGRPHALLVLDNLPDPAAIAMPLVPGCTPEDLRCRLLFTTRRHDLGRFAGVEVTVLPEEPALRLLLRHPSLRGALDPAHPDHEHARAIARMLGRLPLALELAGAYLGKYSGAVSLEGYREGLKSDGALAMLDADAAELTEADLRRVHDPAVAATIGEQWAALRDEPARLLLRVAGLFPESSAVPIARLGLLAGLDGEARPGRVPPLLRAVKCLDDACLVERLAAEQLRLHPLVREFAVAQTPAEQVEEFRRECAARTAAALEDYATFEALEARRGVDGLQEDLIAIIELCPPSASDLSSRLQALLRLLQREDHNLRVGDRESRPLHFAQQVRNRAFLLGIGRLQTTSEQRLAALGRPHFRLRWTASRESPALVRTFVGHHDWVGAVAVTPDGRSALSGSDDCTLKLWDLTTGQPRLTLTGHAGPVYAVAILPDGRRAWSGSNDGTLRLWDLGTGQVCLVLTDHGGPVYALAVTPDERHALSASNDERLTLWDLQTHQVCATFTCPEGPVHALAITPDGSLAISGSTDGHVKVWELRTGRLRRTLVAHEAPVYALGIMPDGHGVLSGALDGTINLWDPHQGRLLASLPGHRDEVHRVGAPVYAVAITPDGRRAISASGDSTLRLWDLSTAQLCDSLVGHERGVTSVAVTPDGRYALSGSTDDTLKLWDLGARQTFPASAGHKKGVTVVVVTPDGRRALSGSRDSTMRLWDLGSPQPNPAVTPHEDWVSALAVTPDGRCALSGCEDCILRLWDLGRGRLRGSLVGHEGGVTAVAITADGRHALSGSRDGSLKLWDLSTHQLLLSFGGSESFVTALAITPDGRWALSGSFDGTLSLWDLQTGELLLILSGRGSFGSAVDMMLDGRTVAPDWSQVRHPRVSAVAITPDGTRAVTGSRGNSGDLRLWDLRTGELCLTLAGHGDDVTALAVAPDGRHLLSASRDRSLRLWDLEGRACRAILLLDSAPMAIAMAPDGRTVVVGDRIGNIHYVEVHADSGGIGLAPDGAVLPQGQHG